MGLFHIDGVDSALSSILTALYKQNVIHSQVLILWQDTCVPLFLDCLCVILHLPDSHPDSMAAGNANHNNTNLRREMQEAEYIGGY